MPVSFLLNGSVAVEIPRVVASVAFNDQRRGRRMRIEYAGDTGSVYDRDGRSLFHAVDA